MTKKTKTSAVNTGTDGKRGAGILLHITSLPSDFGIGDLGPEAKLFADFLQRSGQRYWQLLPLNPTEATQQFSPYSAISSMAGNTMLISPETLLADELLKKTDLEKLKIANSGKVNYSLVQKNKEVMLEKAFQNFSKLASSSMAALFDDFCKTEAFWLDDFALYSLLKDIHKKPWYEWPGEYRFKKKSAMKQLSAQHAKVLELIKWKQFIFFKHWKDLRAYCNARNILLFGDLPFYVSYDSADVWAHPEYFCLDGEGKMTGAAGVPPDYFNADGQLWGMPVFKWNVLKKNQYEWWIDRFKKNLELYDILRLDHFRAFADFWEVPAGENTARNGSWKPGPGAGIFKAAEASIGNLPFVAEDLGEINEPVHQLRKKFGFPGMKVLQFAFGDNMPQSEYIPHNISKNFIVYTGTHDNNTTVGWYCCDIGSKERKNLSQYTGKRIHEKNIHMELIRLAYASVASVAIAPMQDVLGLNESARMNKPASTQDNWEWRLKSKQISDEVAMQLRTWAELYNRI